MARIEDSKGRLDTNSGYGRLFGNDALGRLISRVHVCSIRNGLQLEAILWETTPYKSTLYGILGKELPLTQQGIQVVSGRIIAQYHREVSKSNVDITVSDDNIEARDRAGKKLPITDLLILNNSENILHIVELKDGDVFDTKKADGEIASAMNFANWIRPQVNHRVSYYFCAFNQENKQSIVEGIKGRFNIDQVLTGRELCSLIGVDYDNIRRLRENDQMANKQYFTRQLLNIPEIRDLILAQLGIR